MNQTLIKGEEKVEFEPCCCGQIVSIKHRHPQGSEIKMRVSVHLARLYYSKWKEEGFKEDKSDVEIK